MNKKIIYLLQQLGKNHYKLLFILLFISSILAPVIAIFIQSLGFEPCPLCIYERVPYVIIATIAFIGIVKKQKTKVLLYLIVFVCIGSVVLSAYHVGLERNLFTGSDSCNPQLNITDNASIEEITAQLDNMPLANCSIPAIKVFFLSLTELNMLYSIAMIIGILIVIKVNKINK